MEKNLYRTSARRSGGVWASISCPRRWARPWGITEESELVLRTFGEHIFNRYVEIKRQEWEDYRVQVTMVGELKRIAHAVAVSAS